jgi:hypothetical protein
VGVCQSPAFGGNPILEESDLEAPARWFDIAPKILGLQKPSLVQFVISKAAVAAMNPQAEIQFRITMRDPRGMYFTNMDERCGSLAPRCPPSFTSPHAVLRLTTPCVWGTACVVAEHECVPCC